MKKKLYEVKHRDLNSRYRYIIVAETPIEAIRKFIEAVNKDITYGDRFEEEGITSVEDIFTNNEDTIEIVD